MVRARGKVGLIGIASYHNMVELAIQANIHGKTHLEFIADGQASRLAARNASSARQRIPYSYRAHKVAATARARDLPRQDQKPNQENSNAVLLSHTGLRQTVLRNGRGIISFCSSGIDSRACSTGNFQHVHLRQSQSIRIPRGPSLGLRFREP